MDLFEKCYAFTRAEEAMAADLYPYFTPIQEVIRKQGQGQRPGNDHGRLEQLSGPHG